MAKHTLDARGRACPMPIVELMRTMQTMTDGDTVEVMANDRAFPADVTAWCKKTSNTLVSLTLSASLVDEGVDHIAVVKKGAA